MDKARKIIFFDVDGILTYINSNKENDGIDESRVELLKEIVDKTEADLVVISSWKGYPLDDGTFYKPKCFGTLKRVLSAHGLTIVDETIYVPPKRKENSACKDSDSVVIGDMDAYIRENFEPGYGRSREVYNWLAAHPEVKDFVILDDEDHEWDYYGYDKHWIRPSWFEPDGGLKPEHVKAAVKILMDGGE